MSKSITWFAAILVWFTLGPGGADAQGIIPRIPIGRDGSRIAWIDLGKVPMGWGLIRCSTDALAVRWEKHLGIEGILPAERSPDPSLYLAVAPRYLWRSTGTFFLAVEYWDSKPGAFEVQYMRDVGSATPTSGDLQTKRFYTGGTRFWQWENLALRNTRMQHDLPYGADVRLIPPGTPIRRVFLSRQPLGEVDRVQPWGAQRKVVEPPESLSVFIRPSDQNELLRPVRVTRSEQRLNLYASWGAEAVLMKIKRGQLMASRSSEEIPIAAWPRMFAGQRVRVVMDIGTAEPDEILFSMWDTGEIQRWAQAAKTVSRLASRRWLEGVIVDLRNIVGMAPSATLGLAWQTPAVLQDFRRAVRKELGTLPRINRTWQTRYQRQQDITPFLKDQAPSSEAAQFVSRWLQDQQAYILDRILQTWRSFLPHYPVFVRLPYPVGWGRLDPRDLCEIARRYDVSILVCPENPNPVVDPDWLLLARAARQTGVDIGLDIRAEEPGALSAALFALATEGGTTLILSEDDLARSRVLELYKSGVKLMDGSRQARPAAVLYPWTTMQTAASQEFDERFARLRDAVPLDLLDERDLVDPSTVTKYSILVHLAGCTWPEASLSGLEQWIRQGGLFLCAGDQRIVDEQGRLEVMARLFPFQLKGRGRSLTLSPISKRLLNTSVLSPFQDLRADWLKEVGRGYTLYVPKADQNTEAYIDLVTMILRDPSLISPRLGAGVKGDGLTDGLFTAQIGSETILLNLNPDPQTPGTPHIAAGRSKSLSVSPWGLARSAR